MEAPLQLLTVWRTTTEHCEIVWSAFRGYRVRLWVQNRIFIDEMMSDVDAAISRAVQLREQWAS
jgi:hypothetical protein